MSGYKPIIITARVAEALKKAKVKNVEFTKLTESEIDIGSLKIAGVWP